MEIRNLIGRELSNGERGALLLVARRLKEEFGLQVYKVVVTPHFGVGRRPYSVTFTFDRVADYEVRL
jgi:hypothetical protein